MNRGDTKDTSVRSEVRAPARTCGIWARKEDTMSDVVTVYFIFLMLLYML